MLRAPCPRPPATPAWGNRHISGAGLTLLLSEAGAGDPLLHGHLGKGIRTQSRGLRWPEASITDNWFLSGPLETVAALRNRNHAVSNAVHSRCPGHK